MQLYFIRHGQSVNNYLWAQGGNDKDHVPDPELTNRGQEQVKLVARFLVNKQGVRPATDDARQQNVDGFGITHIYTSPMIRAMDTAAAIAESLDLTPVVWADVHEWGGIWRTNEETGMREGLPGPNRAFFEERYPQFSLPDCFDDQGWWNRPLETYELCFERAKRCLADLQVQHGQTKDRVALISHGAFYGAMLVALLGLALGSRFWFSLNNAAITRIDFRKDQTRLAYQNRVDFLPPGLVT